MLKIEYSPRFKRDYKKLIRKHKRIELLDHVIRLIAADNEASNNELLTHHNMHALKGNWAGANECHVANFGDWLLVWKVANGVAYLVRTGTHDEIFRQ